MRSKLSSAFTLIEVVTVLAIIIILTGIIISLSGYVTRNSYKQRARAEMAMLTSAITNYKTETGGYPQEINTNGNPGVTDKLSPKRDFNPMANEYENSSVYLYKELTGDKTGAAGTPDGVPDNGEPVYLKQFDRKHLLMTQTDPSTGAITKVRGFQDPWGFFYGYSTAAAAAEQQFERDLKVGKATARKTGDDMPGYNAASFDLWSTCGDKPTTSPTDPKTQEQAHARWEKNW